MHQASNGYRTKNSFEWSLTPNNGRWSSGLLPLTEQSVTNTFVPSTGASGSDGLWKLEETRRSFGVQTQVRLLACRSPGREDWALLRLP